jgi:hypothetical protein
MHKNLKINDVMNSMLLFMYSCEPKAEGCVLYTRLIVVFKCL